MFVLFKEDVDFRTARLAWSMSIHERQESQQDWHGRCLFMNGRNHNKEKKNEVKHKDFC
jgi:hypothetical protein